jgi:hypothetical protein
MFYYKNTVLLCYSRMENYLFSTDHSEQNVTVGGVFNIVF